MTTHTVAWPPPNGLTTRIVSRKQAVIVLSAATRISAPAEKVFDAVVDVENYGKWNSFCPEVKITKQPAGVEDDGKLHQDTNFVFNVIMDASKPESRTSTSLKVSDFSTPSAPSSYIAKDVLEGDGSFTSDLSRVYRVAWTDNGGLMNKALHLERFHEVIVLGDNECEVRTWELLSGLLAHIVKLMYQKTLEGEFESWMNDLKKYCEGK